MSDLKYYFESTEKGEKFYSDIFSSNMVIESIYVDNLDKTYNGFDLYLIDKNLNIKMRIMRINQSKTDLLLKLSEKQQLEIVSAGIGKILLQGKLY